jgi:GNAT superfamily N-acetyltransferase
MSDVLGGMALVTAPIPVVGDVAGAVSDAAMYAAYPEERTMLNAGMSLAGLLPFVPGAGGVMSVKRVAEEAMNTNPGLKLNIYGTPETGYTLSRIEVPKDQRNSGVGSSVMSAIVEAADQEGAKVALSPSADFGGNKKRLEDFYQRFGFTSNKGKSKDFSTMETMLRQPRPVQRAELDMSQAARMQRAIEQVYTPTLYHGTAADIEEFNPAQFGGSATKARSAKLGTWMVDNPEVAGGYARFAAEDVPVQRLLDQAMRAERSGNFNEADRFNVLAENLELGGELRGGGGQNIMPIRARGKFFEIDAEGATMSDLDDNQLTDWAQEAKAKGFDGIKINNFSDNVDYGQYMPATHYLVFDPANIRSANAAFDPSKRGSANLMAGIMGGAVGLSALRNIKQQEEK